MLSQDAKQAICHPAGFLSHFLYLMNGLAYTSSTTINSCQITWFLQVISCIWKHPNAPVVYLSCDLLGREEILVEVSKTFGSNIFVDKSENSDCFQALFLAAPEILTEDASSRFQVRVLSFYHSLKDSLNPILLLIVYKEQLPKSSSSSLVFDYGSLPDAT